jgi:hypothetical protein
MSTKYLVPALLATLLAGSAFAQPASTDPVRARVVAELEQARKDGSYPPSEADYVYPNWVKVANPAGVVMTDGHPEDYEARSTASVAGNTTGTASAPSASVKPAVAQMTDGHPEFDAAARTGKGADAAR